LIQSTQRHQRPLHKFPLIDTHSPDEFRQMLAKHFGAFEFDIQPGGPSFEAHRSYFRIKNVDLVFGSCSDAFKVRFPSVMMVKQQFALCGFGRTTLRGSQYNISTSEAAVVPAGVEMLHEYEAGFQSIIFRADASALQGKLSAVAGLPITRNIEFVAGSKAENPAVRRLRRLLEFMV